MFDVGAVKGFIAKSKFGFLDDIRYRSSDNRVIIYCPAMSFSEVAADGSISQRQLESLLTDIRNKFNVNADAILVKSDEHKKLEDGLLVLLSNRFEGQVISIFLSFLGDRAVDLWVEVDASLGDKADLVKEASRDILSASGFEIREAYLQVSRGFRPTYVATLKALKVIQPCKLSEIMSYLISLDFDGVNEKWLLSHLDSLRKRKLIFRQKNELYVLTEVALRVVPSGKSRGSSDVERALAFGKMKW